jgi:hypothetical protein
MKWEIWFFIVFLLIFITPVAGDVLGENYTSTYIIHSKIDTIFCDDIKETPDGLIVNNYYTAGFFKSSFHKECILISGEYRIQKRRNTVTITTISCDEINED